MPEAASSAKIISRKNYRRATWKNGLGFTDEIAIHPEGAELRRGDFLWRLSSARIEQASPFSAFPAHDRTLVILKGAGVQLTHAFDEGGEEESAEVSPLVPYDFPGDVPSRCELIAGPITDLSVFVRKSEVEAFTEALVVQEGGAYDWVPTGRWNFAFAVQSTFEVKLTDHKMIQKLCEGDTLQVNLSEPMTEAYRLRPTGGAGKLVIVSLST